MFFLRTCRVCGRELVEGERMICLHCIGAMPLWSGSVADLRAHRFPRSVPVGGVWPWLVYTNADPVCALIRSGKFDDRPELIEELSRRYAAWLIDKGYLAGIDALIPVPMHWWKRLRRGYNQAELIADAISAASGIPVCKAIRAVRGHSVQSRNSGAMRAANVVGVFSLRHNHGIRPGMRIALIDDILTTGATLSEAVRAVMPASPCDITILTLAATQLH